MTDDLTQSVDQQWSAVIEPRLIHFDPAARDLISGAIAEAVDLRHRTIASEHLLLAVLREPESDASRALADHGLTYGPVRDFVAGMSERATTPGPLGIGDDFVAVIQSAIDSTHAEHARAALGPAHLVLALTRAPGPVTKALLDSYAVPAESVAVTQPQSQVEPALPETFRGASPLAQADVHYALVNNLTIDGFVHRLLQFRDDLNARVTLTIRALDGDIGDIVAMIADACPALRLDSSAPPDKLLQRALAEVPQWLARTGDSQPDTIHLLLAALGAAPKAEFTHALRVYGVTSDLLVSAAVSIRFDIGSQDKPGAPTMMTPNSRRGPAPRPASAREELPQRLAGVRFRRRLFRGMTVSGDNVNTDLQMRRIKRYTAALTLSAGSGVVFVMTLVVSAINSGNWWILLAVALAALRPEAAPIPIWLVAEGIGLYFLPWPARIALILLVVSLALPLWLELQFRRSDVADPTFNLKRLRHDMHSSNRAVVQGGPR